MTSAHPRPPVSQGKASSAISTHRREGGPRRACLSASQHLLHRSRRVRLASASEVTLRGKRLRDLPQRLSLSVQLVHQCDHLRHLPSVGEATAAATTCRYLALACGSQLGDHTRLLKLTDSPNDLPHEHSWRTPR